MFNHFPNITCLICSKKKRDLLVTLYKFYSIIDSSISRFVLKILLHKLCKFVHYFIWFLILYEMLDELMLISMQGLHWYIYLLYAGFMVHISSDLNSHLTTCFCYLLLWNFMRLILLFFVRSLSCVVTCVSSTCYRKCRVGRTYEVCYVL